MIADMKPTRKGKTMTSVLIENVSPEFLPKLKKIAKAANAEFKQFVADIKTSKPEKAVSKTKEPEFYELKDSPAFKKGLKALKSLPKHEQNAIKQRVESQMYGV